jgi:hypothetical protein
MQKYYLYGEYPTKIDKKSRSPAESGFMAGECKRIALGAERLERAENVGQGDGGILRLRIVELRTSGGIGSAALQRAAHARNFLEKTHLERKHLVSAHVGGIGGNLLRNLLTSHSVVRDNAVGFRPILLQESSSDSC